MREDNRAAPAGQDLARKLREYPQFAWLSEDLGSVPEGLLGLARVLVEQGFDPQGPEVLRALRLDSDWLAQKREREDIARRAKRKPGQGPLGKPLEERRRYVAVRILCRFFARMLKPRPRLHDGSPLCDRAAAILATAGVELGEVGDELEAHPRARPKPVRAGKGAGAARLGRELAELERREFRTPDESGRTLPWGTSGASRRNHRRQREARERYDQENRAYERQQKLVRKAAEAGNGNVVTNPAGVKPLPLREGRKARRIASGKEDALRFMMSLPRELRWALFQAATKFGARGRFCAPAMLVYACFAFLLEQSEEPRPVMRRAGYTRAVEGLPREALASAFVWNPYTRSPYHANTISKLVAQLEEVGLVRRESPNSLSDAYKGTTGWALNVYRLRSALDLAALLLAMGYAPVPEGLDEMLRSEAEPGPS